MMQIILDVQVTRAWLGSKRLELWLVAIVGATYQWVQIITDQGQHRPKAGKKKKTPEVG